MTKAHSAAPGTMEGSAPVVAAPRTSRYVEPQSAANIAYTAARLPPPKALPSGAAAATARPGLWAGTCAGLCQPQTSSSVVATRTRPRGLRQPLPRPPTAPPTKAATDVGDEDGLELSECLSDRTLVRSSVPKSLGAVRLLVEVSSPCFTSTQAVCRLQVTQERPDFIAIPRRLLSRRALMLSCNTVLSQMAA